MLFHLTFFICLLLVSSRRRANQERQMKERDYKSWICVSMVLREASAIGVDGGQPQTAETSFCKFLHQTPFTLGLVW